MPLTCSFSSIHTACILLQLRRSTCLQVENAQELDAQDGIDITASCMAHFLRHHLPLTTAQQAALDSACETVSVHGGQAQSTEQGLSLDTAPFRGVAGGGLSASPAQQDQSGGSDGHAGRRTRSHSVDAADLEALKQVARGRIFTCKVSAGPGMQTAMPAAAT